MIPSYLKIKSALHNRAHVQALATGIFLPHAFMTVLRSVVSCCHGQKLARGMYHSSIRRRAVGFLVLQFWLSLDWFSGFCFKKTLVFLFSPFWFVDFMQFSI